MGRGGVALGPFAYSPGDPKRHIEHPRLLALEAQAKQIVAVASA